MASKGQMTGMRGVFLVAAELSRLGYIVSPTSRSAAGADLLVTNQSCSKAFSVQVKTNARTFSFWLLSKKCKKLKANSHIYVFVNLRKGGTEPEYFILPSRDVAKHMKLSEKGWHHLRYDAALPYRDKWNVFGTPG